MADLYQRDRLAARLGEVLDLHNFVLSRYFSAETLDFQRVLEGLVAQGANAIGTTGRGIGPAYEDKVARRAVRVADLFQRDRLAARLGEILDFHNFVLTRYFSAEPVDFQRVLDDLVAQAERVQPLLEDVSERLRISPNCALILPTHIALVRARERAKGVNAIGTTGRGIGPAYEDKVARRFDVQERPAFVGVPVGGAVPPDRLDRDDSPRVGHLLEPEVIEPRHALPGVVQVGPNLELGLTGNRRPKGAGSPRPGTPRAHSRGRGGLR